jgi:hypothetical protein
MTRSKRPACQQRVVLLGASNLTNGFATALRILRQMFPQPLDVLAALGHGRSLALDTVVLVRQLPGIDGCGLWPALAAREPLPTSALITDLGNDLLYNAETREIGDWLQRQLDRLAVVDARVTITELPVENLPLLPRWQYYAMRRVMYPGCQVGYEEIIERARALNDIVRRVAAERGLTLVGQQRAWYGLDPIHFRRRFWSTAWGTFLAPLGDGRPVAVGGRPPATVSAYALAPEQRWLWRWEQRRRQPARRLPDGTTISIY